jgi:hypothetical protein
MQTTDRYINHRKVSFTTNFSTCSTQGIATGWADTYNIGIP